MQSQQSSSRSSSPPMEMVHSWTFAEDQGLMLPPNYEHSVSPYPEGVLYPTDPTTMPFSPIDSMSWFGVISGAHIPPSHPQHSAQVLAMPSAASNLSATSNYPSAQINVAYPTVQMQYGAASVAPGQFHNAILLDTVNAGLTAYNQSLPNGPTSINSPGSNTTDSSVSSPYSTPQMEQEAIDPNLTAGLTPNARMVLESCQPIARADVLKALGTQEYHQNQMLHSDVVASLLLIEETEVTPGKGGPGSRKPIQHFTCKICLKRSTMNRRTIEDHINSHFGLKPLLCHVPDCGKSFLRTHERFRHEQDVHKLDPKRGPKGGKRTPLGRLKATPLDNPKEFEAQLQQLGISVEGNKLSKKSTKRPNSAPASSPFNVIRVSPQAASASNAMMMCEKTWVARVVRLKDAIWFYFGLCAM